jgi:hypothetical protein
VLEVEEAPKGAAVDRLRKLSGSIAGFTLFAGAAALLTPQARRRLGIPSWLLWLAASIGAAITVNELVGKPVPARFWTTRSSGLSPSTAGAGYLLRLQRAADGRAMPREARLYSVGFNTANAVIARRILAHAGVDDRATVLVGTLGDGGKTIRTLRREYNFTPGSLDLVFLDHDKNAYLSDLELILAERWLHPGSVVVADNILVPGAPAYCAHMRDNDGTLWHTTEHRTHAEYQSVIKDVVLESDYLGT